jgi:uncharacterized membrane protein
MNDAWTLVAVTAVATIALKSVGPVLLGGRPLPDRVAGVMELLAPALLAALIATNTFADGRSLVVDERVAGLGAAAVALAFRAPLLAVVIIAAATTAILRAVA